MIAIKRVAENTRGYRLQIISAIYSPRTCTCTCTRGISDESVHGITVPIFKPIPSLNRSSDRLYSQCVASRRCENATIYSECQESFLYTFEQSVH